MTMNALDSKCCSYYQHTSDTGSIQTILNQDISMIPSDSLEIDIVEELERDVMPVAHIGYSWYCLQPSGHHVAYIV